MAFELQKNFNAGEISPKIYYRDDNQFRFIKNSGLKTILNMSPEPQGSLESRRGFDLVSEITSTIKDEVKLIDFEINNNESYCAVYTLSTLDILDEDGPIISQQIVPNGKFSFGGQNWSLNGNSAALGFAQIRPFSRINITVPVQVGNVQMTIDVSGSNGISEEREIAPYIVMVGTTSGNNDLYNSGILVGSRLKATFTHLGTDTQVFVTIEAQQDFKDIRKVYIYDFFGASPAPISFTTTYSLSDIPKLKAVGVPGETTLYVFGSDNVIPKQLTYVAGTYGENPVWDYINMSFQAGGGALPWGTIQPLTATFYDGRMALGGSSENPTTVWLSKPNDYLNFDMGTAGSALPDDALTLPLNSNGKIKWIKGVKKLIIGMDTGEHIIFANGTLAPSDAQTEKQSVFGSANIDSVSVGEELAYVNPIRRQVRLMNYVRDENGWASYEITFNADHITEGLIKELKFNYSLIGRFTLLDYNGELIMGNFERDRQTIGWHKFNVNGKILSVTTMKRSGRYNMWIAVERNGKLLIESENFTPNSTHYMDSAKQVVLQAPGTTFTGFQHLANLSVQVVADGLVQKDIVVTGSGDIVLNQPATVVVAGVGYNKKIETLPRQKETQKGNTFNHMKQWSKIAVSLLNSSKPIINGVDTFLRTPSTPINTRESLVTEIVESSDDKWSKYATITIEQPLPVPLVINGIGGKIEENEL